MTALIQVKTDSKFGVSLARRCPLFIMMVLLTACGSRAPVADRDAPEASPVPPGSETQAATDANAPNFIFLIADDMGVETLATYGIGETVADTPNIDRLASGGVQFTNFWVQPTCSPTRATLLTGRYGFRTGVLIPAYPRGDLIDVEVPAPEAGRKELKFSPRGFVPPGVKLKPPPSVDLTAEPVDGLPPEEITLPQLLKSLPAGYATAAVGKWHLADSRNGWLDAPNQAGFDYYSGLHVGVTDSYFSWLHVEQGKARAERGYLDEQMVEDGISWVRKQAAGDRPWFLWAAFTNPHSPITLPPKHLLRSEASLNLTVDALTPDNTQPYAMAMIEAMDTLIGRLLEGVPESERSNTYIIFLGDNGSVKWAQPAAPVDPNRAKMTIYEGGIRTPLIVAGPRVSKGARTAALANSVDLFATVLDMVATSDQATQLAESGTDSRSLVDVLEDPSSSGPRTWIYADTAPPVGPKRLHYAIRDRHYKLIEKAGVRELYHLASDPWETTDLLAGEPSDAELSVVDRLSSQVSELWQSTSQN